LERIDRAGLQPNDRTFAVLSRVMDRKVLIEALRRKEAEEAGLQGEEIAYAKKALSSLRKAFRADELVNGPLRDREEDGGVGDCQMPVVGDISAAWEGLGGDAVRRWVNG